MALVLFPIDYLHGHEKDTHQCHDRFEFKNDLCHISIFHKELKEKHCQHEQHFVDSHEECELCKYLLSKKLDVVINANYFTIDKTNFQTKYKDTYSLLLSCFKDQRLGRAPPIA